MIETIVIIMSIINVVCCFIAIFFIRRRIKRLDRREVNLEKYARDLDDYDRRIKVREVQVTGIIRRDERLKHLRDSNQKVLK